MRVHLNGSQMEIEEGLTVRQLLERADPAYHHGLVELNGAFLPVKGYDRVLVEGDRLEVILPAFGG